MYCWGRDAVPMVVGGNTHVLPAVTAVTVRAGKCAVQFTQHVHMSGPLALLEHHSVPTTFACMPCCCYCSPQVLRVNGVEVLNLAHLKQLIMGKGSRTPTTAAVEPAAEPTAMEVAVTEAAAAAEASSSSSGQASSPSSNGSSSGGYQDSSVTGSSSGSDGSSSASSSMDGSSEGDLEVGSPAWDDKFIQIELEDDRQIIMERAAASAATERLQRRYRVPYLCSADLAD